MLWPWHNRKVDCSGWMMFIMESDFTEPNTHFIGNIGRYKTKRLRVHISILLFKTHKVYSASIEARWCACLEPAKFKIMTTKSVGKT